MLFPRRHDFDFTFSPPNVSLTTARWIQGNRAIRLKIRERRDLEGGNGFIAESKLTSLVPVCSGQTRSPNFPMDMDNKSTKTSIHTHTLSPDSHSITASCLCLYIDIYPSGRTLARFAPSPRHPRFVCPLLHPKTAHATEEDWCRSREQGDFSFLFFSKIFAPLSYYFLLGSLFILTPFFAALFALRLFSFSSLVSFFLRGCILRPCNDSHHVLFLFLLSYLSGASSPSLKCITVRRVSHTILQGGG